MKDLHYNIDRLMCEDAQISISYGERSNGKSYQLKHKVMLTPSVLEGDERFMLIRRSKNEITTEKIERYFNDCDIERLTDGKYNCISVWRRELFLSVYDSKKAKMTRYKKIGYVVPLEDEQYYAGASFLDVPNMIFEEFMSRKTYLPQEPSKLMNLYCTVDRKRGSTKLWLCGNTISRVCPYLTDWELMDLMRSQKQGDIKTKLFDVGENQFVKLAVEYCESTGRTSYVIGAHSDMMTSGVWQSDPQPHLPKSLKCYSVVFSCVFRYKQFTFLARYLTDNETGEGVWFICDKYNRIQPGTFIFSDEITPDRHSFRDPYHVHTRNESVLRILDTFTEDRIFYSTDLCGTDFKQSIDFIIKR